MPAAGGTPSAAKIEQALDKQVAATGDVALAGSDGRKAEQLLEVSRREGAAVLADITRRALKRLLTDDGSKLLLSKRLFSDPERQDLIEAIAATNATASLLGRSRIRLRQQRYRQHAEVAKFSDPTPFEIFDDGEDPLKPLAPEKALEYFRRKVPWIGVTAKQLTEDENRRAFTLAVQADEVLLGKVQAAITNVIETGEAVSTTPRAIAKLLEAAGVETTVSGRRVGGAYSELVFRNAMMESYREGAAQELKEVEDDFPVWRWLGIRDGRQRSSHERFFDKYFPSSVTLADVRDQDGFDGHNDRCDFAPIYVSEWKRLRAAGARIADGYTDPVPA